MQPTETAVDDPHVDEHLLVVESRGVTGYGGPASAGPWRRTRWLATFAGLAVVVVIAVWWVQLRGPGDAADGLHVLHTASIVRQSTELPPTVYTYRVKQRFQHDPLAFTQGLLWLNGVLYESTGLNGRSGVREVRLDEAGKATIVRETMTPRWSDFGEGLVHIGGGELLQLLWQRGEGYRYDAQAGPDGHLRLVGGKYGFKTPRSDGWGLASDGEQLLMTDSGPDVFFLDSETFELRRQVRVMDGERVVQMVNELEFIEGELWANVFGSDCIARISPETGSVNSWVVLTGLLDRMNETKAARREGRAAPDVLNGIAWDAEARRLFVTGKLWPHLFEIEVVPTTEMSLEDARRLCIPTRNIFSR